MERDPAGIIKLTSEIDVLNCYLVMPDLDDPEGQDLLDLVSGEEHELPLQLTTKQSEILMACIEGALDDPLEFPSIKEAAGELLESLE